ncbi:MAG: hypothetical protein KDA47_11905 [Planctomycetales bacterium]|nr:hypothetical protein [Planctomycetales bacterium]
MKVCETSERRWISGVVGVICLLAACFAIAPASAQDFGASPQGPAMVPLSGIERAQAIYAEILGPFTRQELEARYREREVQRWEALRRQWDELRLKFPAPVSPTPTPMATSVTRAICEPIALVGHSAEFGQDCDPLSGGTLVFPNDNLIIRTEHPLTPPDLPQYEPAIIGKSKPRFPIEIDSTEADGNADKPETVVAGAAMSPFWVLGQLLTGLWTLLQDGITAAACEAGDDGPGTSTNIELSIPDTITN